MAAVPYNEGAGPDVEPNVQAPNDLMRIQSSPEMFGGLIGRGAQEFGQGAEQASKFFTQVSSDQAMNNTMKALTTLDYGDPNQTVQHPDGTTGPDTGYFGSRGYNTVAGYNDYRAKYDQIIAEQRGHLSGEGQLEYDRSTQRLRAIAMERAGAHYDQQQGVWATDQNTDTSKQALNAISAAPNDQIIFDYQRNRLVTSMMKNAIVKGGNPQDTKSAAEAANQQAWRARIEAIGVTDPVAAYKLADAHKNDLGTLYPEMGTRFKAHADAQTAKGAGADEYQKAQQGQPTPSPAAPSPASQPKPTTAAAGVQVAGPAVAGGFDYNSYVARTQEIESGGRSDAVSPAGAKTVDQFTPSTWAESGGGDMNDPATVARNMRTLTTRNFGALENGLGRPPTAAELYLAHQQGAGGALHLMADPSRRAGDVVGDAAIRGNGGNPDAPAGDFVALWKAKFNRTPIPQGIQYAQPAQGLPPSNQVAELGEAISDVGLGPAEHFFTPPAPEPEPAGMTPAQPGGPPPAPVADPAAWEAAAVRAIEGRKDLTIEQQQVATSEIRQRAAMDEIAMEATAKAQRQKEDQQSDGYFKRIFNGQTNNIVRDIANDPYITDFRTKEALINIARKQTGQDEEVRSPNFWKAFKAVNAPPGDPEKITDPSILYQMAGQGDLSLKDVNELSANVEKNRKSDQDHNFNTSLASVLDGYKKKMSFDSEMAFPGVPQSMLKDPKGEQLFATQFVPRVLAEVDQLQKGGKDGWAYLADTKHLDAIAAQIRPPGEMAKDRLMSTGGLPAGAQLPEPTVPRGVDPKAWATVTAQPAPYLPTGQPFNHAAWEEAVSRLVQKPDVVTPQFDELFGKGAAATVLQQLAPGKPAASQEHGKNNVVPLSDWRARAMSDQ